MTLSNVEFLASYDFDPRVLFLPERRGYGDLPDLSIAMSLDSDLLDMVSEIAEQDAGDLMDAGFDAEGKLKAVLFKWAGGWTG